MKVEKVFGTITDGYGRERTVLKTDGKYTPYVVCALVESIVEFLIDDSPNAVIIPKYPSVFFLVLPADWLEE